VPCARLSLGLSYHGLVIAPGTTVGSYVVVRALSSDGGVDAFLARSSAGRLVVLKMSTSNDRAATVRLRDEARLGARVFHQRLVETLDEIDHAGIPVLVLGFVEGPTLEELRSQGTALGPLAPASAARIGCHIAEALGAIHDAIGDDGQPLLAVHGDVTTAHVVVGPTGDAVLSTVGAAGCFAPAAGSGEGRRRAHAGADRASARFVAPEVVAGSAATAASDFYSLGCVIIEACTGRAVSPGAPLPPRLGEGLPPALRAVIERLVAQRPADRFHAAHEVSSALRAVEEALGGGAAALAARARTFAVPDIDAARAMPTPEVPAEGPSQNAMALQSRSDRLGVGPASGSAGAGGGLRRPPREAQGASHFAMHLEPPPAPTAMSAAAPTPFSTLELDIAPRPPAPVAQPPAREPLQRPRAAARAGTVIGDAAKKILLAIVLLAGAALAWRWHDGNVRAADRRAIDARLADDAAAVKKALANTAVDCAGDGGFWVYEDRTGQPVIVDAVGKIPKQYRSAARCVRPER
jgi:hypothetical protein